VCQEFFLDNDGVLKEKKDGAVPQNILSAKFNVLYARFVINGAVPRITIAMSVQDESHSDNPPLLIQTTISKR
jgi:hypothetical protein